MACGAGAGCVPTDFHFVSSDAGEDSGPVFPPDAKVDSGSEVGAGPVAPSIDDPANPPDGATWSPTRLALRWSASPAADGGAPLVYDVYFVEGASIPSSAVPYKSGLTTTLFVVQADSDGRIAFEPDPAFGAPIFLASKHDYAWRVCARDTFGRTTCSAARVFHTDASIAAWWRFDANPATSPDCAAATPGAKVCDSSGNGNDGVLTGTVDWIAPGTASGVLGGALRFDGASTKVTVAASPSLDLGAAGVVSCRITVGSLSTTEILSKDAPAPGPYVLGLDAASHGLFFGLFGSAADGGGDWLYSRADVTPFLAGYARASGNYGASYLAIYVDGQAPGGQTPLTGAIANNGNSLKLGYSTFHADYFAGTIDECLILSRAFASPAEVANLALADGG
jgi:hypothetical protein